MVPLQVGGELNVCGIAGVLGCSDDANVRAMLATLRHRGPDDEHSVTGARFTLGARRLSIIDLEGGRQPLANEDGTIWAAQNGEIYNFVELRPKLEQLGHRFRTRTDTEVLVHLYEERGEAMVDELAGMYAFALWDSARDVGLLVRDRVGKKPLYYWQDRQDHVWFASEIKAILRAPGFERRLCRPALHHYLSFKHVPAPLSIFEGVAQLPPAHLLRVTRTTEGRLHLEVRPYWRADFGDPDVARMDPTEIEEELLRRLRLAVQRRLVSDVPIGFFLSGGVDSSLSTAIAAELSGKPIETFTLTYGSGSTTPAKELDRVCARKVAERYGTNHHEETIEAVRLEDTLPLILSHFDEPFSGVISSYFLSARIARHVKVALAGDGADELFGSYLSHRLAFPLENWAQGRRCSDDLRPFDGDPAFLERIADRDDWRWRSRLLVFSDEEKAELYSADAAAEAGDLSSSLEVRRWFEALTARDALNRVLEAEFRTQLPDQVLCYADRLSMAHSLEVRAPFLDHEFVGFAAAIPGALKIRDAENKYILKKAALRYLPHEVVYRPKEGFLMPINPWLRERLRGFVEDVLSPSHLGRHGLFRPRVVEALCARFYEGEERLGTKVFTLLAFQLWYEAYLDRVPTSEAPC